VLPQLTRRTRAWINKRFRCVEFRIGDLEVLRMQLEIASCMIWLGTSQPHVILDGNERDLDRIGDVEVLRMQLEIASCMIWLGTSQPHVILDGNERDLDRIGDVEVLRMQLEIASCMIWLGTSQPHVILDTNTSSSSVSLITERTYFELEVARLASGMQGFFLILSFCPCGCKLMDSCSILFAFHVNHA